MSFIPIAGSDYTDIARRRLSGEIPELTWLRQFRDLLKPYLRPGMVVADFGCATGYAYTSLAAFGVRYVGIDFEPTYLSIGRDHFAGNPEVSFRRHDITAAPLDIRADVVICSAMLEHCPALEPALTNMAGVAGRLFLLRTFVGDDEVIDSYVAPVPGNDAGAIKYSNVYARRDLERRLSAIGFDVRMIADRYTGSESRSVQGRDRAFRVVLAEKGDAG